jgi:hypothetical protein
MTKATLILPYFTQRQKRLLCLLSLYQIPFEINPNCAIPNRYSTDIETEIIDYIRLNNLNFFIILDTFLDYYSILSNHVHLCYNGISELNDIREIIDLMNKYNST